MPKATRERTNKRSEGCYKRPPGRSPNGKAWDSTIGAWVTKPFSKPLASIIALRDALAQYAKSSSKKNRENLRAPMVTVMVGLHNDPTYRAVFDPDWSAAERPEGFADMLKEISRNLARALVFNIAPCVWANPSVFHNLFIAQFMAYLGDAAPRMQPVLLSPFNRAVSDRFKKHSNLMEALASYADAIEGGPKQGDDGKWRRDAREAVCKMLAWGRSGRAVRPATCPSCRAACCRGT